MKVSIDIDCTPEEARAFFGLPDMRLIQDEMMKMMGERMKAGLAETDMAELMKLMTPGLQGFEQFQKLFWSQFTGAGRPSGKGGKE